MPDMGEKLRFGEFELDFANRQLRRDGEAVELGSRYFDALALMVREAGTLVPKDRFMDEVWRGIPVTDEALTQCIRSLRRALGDDAAAPRYIQTVPKHGYRFIAIPTGMAGAQNVPVASLRLPGAVAGASTLAGVAAGALGGLFYGVVAGTGGISTVLALTALVAALGLLAGAGVGLGMASALVLRARADGALVLGGAIGGMAVGALGGTLGRDGIALLTGSLLGPVTGIFEGLVLGAASGAACLFALRHSERMPPLSALSTMTVGGLAGLFIHITGGKLLGGTLHTLEQDLGGTRLSLGRIGVLTGEASFGRTANLVTTIAEAALFVLAIAISAFAVRRRS